MEFRHTGEAVFILFFIFFVFLALLFPNCSLAQSATGGLHGQVTDPSGAAVVNARVVVTSSSGKVITADANRDGAYEVKNLAPGLYGVNVTAKGFAPFAILDFEISANQMQKLDVTLSIQVQEQKVVVEGETPVLDLNPESNAGAIVMTAKDLQALSDDPDELLNDLEALAGPSAGPNGGQIYIDGFTAGQLPPKSAIREIRVNQNPFSSEYDKLGYGRIEVFTKPGADKYHGEFQLQGNASAFNSKNPFATSEPGYDSTLFSGNIGGPIGKKTSFYFTSQYRDINDVSVVNAQVLDANFNPVPFTESVAVPRKRLNLGPRVDYQVTPNNTLSVRYQYYRDDINNQGLQSGFALASQAYDVLSSEHTLQIGDTQVIGTKMVNETRFQFLHAPFSQTPASTAAAVFVPGAFLGGGSAAGTIRATTNRYEVQNYTQIVLRKHTLKFGARLREVTDDNNATPGFNGTFTFSSLTAYQITQMGLAQMPPLTFAQIQAMGGGATQFSITTGNPQTNASLFDAGIYVQDDWKVRPNLTVSGGLRLETQTGIDNHLNWAPRVALAWGIGRGKSTPKTVLRVGVGLFYDRFSDNLILQANRLNGVNQQQFVIPSPCFFPTVPSLPITCPGLPPTILPTVYRISPNLHAPGVLLTAVVLERQLSKIANLSITYLNSRGFDQLLTNNINAPLPGTFPANPVYPSGSPGNIYEYQSEGVFRQNQLFAQVNIRAGSKFTLFGNYVLNYVNSDTSDANSFPSNPFNLQQDYGRASFDYRNRFYMGGTIGFPHGIRLSPFMIVSSGQPYSITLSDDLIGSSQFNQRPAFASAASLPQNVVVTPFGTFDTIPVPGEKIVPINSLVGPPRFTLNLRLSKTWGFGALPERPGEASAAGGGGPRGGPGGGGRGGGMGGFGAVGGAPTNKRYNLTLGVNARNVFNYTNLNTPTAVLNPPSAGSPTATQSPFFGVSNALQGGAFSSQSASRLIYLQLGFTF
jgi:hypothetical protein